MKTSLNQWIILIAFISSVFTFCFWKTIKDSFQKMCEEENIKPAHIFRSIVILLDLGLIFLLLKDPFHTGYYVQFSLDRGEALSAEALVVVIIVLLITIPTFFTNLLKKAALRESIKIDFIWLFVVGSICAAAFFLKVFFCSLFAAFLGMTAGYFIWFKLNKTK